MRRYLHYRVELSYQLVYVEMNGKSPPKDQWSLRQTGVYQRCSPSDGSSVLILLHPMDSTSAQERLEYLAGSKLQDERDLLEEYPLHLHLVILSSYLNNWQAYIESLVSMFTILVSTTIDSRSCG